MKICSIRLRSAVTVVSRSSHGADGHIEGVTQHVDLNETLRGHGPKRAIETVDASDEVFGGQGFKMLNALFRGSGADAFNEHWIGTRHCELLDRTRTWNRNQLERLVIDYVDRYKADRPLFLSSTDYT